MNKMGWTSWGWYERDGSETLRRWKWYGSDEVFVETNDDDILAVFAVALRELGVTS